MSFWTVLKRVGTTALAVEKAIAPVAAFVPGLQVLSVIDPIVTKVQAAIVTAEQNHPIDGQGKLKADAVIADLTAGMEATNQILAAFGERVTWDIDLANAAIKAQADAYNAFAKFKDSIKKEKIQ